MTTMEEVSSIPKKLQKYKSELETLFRGHEITGAKTLLSNYKNSTEFRDEWKSIWANVAKDEGGKLSLTTIGLLIGASLGGVGIAAGGGAIGVPLALILGLGGFLSGSKVDSLSFFGEKRPILAKVRKRLLMRIREDAKVAGLSVAEFVEQILEAAYPDENTKVLEKSDGQI